MRKQLKSLHERLPVLIACLALVLTGVFAQNPQTEKTPAVILKDLKGKTVSLEEVKGKVILVNFWAIWCAPCLAKIPELIKWQKEYENQGLQIIGVTYLPTNQVKVRNFASKNKINYPILFGSKKTESLFDSGDAMPFTVIIDREGIIKERIEGVIFADEFEEKVKTLIESGTKQKTAKTQQTNMPVRFGVPRRINTQ